MHILHRRPQASRWDAAQRRWRMETTMKHNTTSRIWELFVRMANLVSDPAGSLARYMATERDLCDATDCDHNRFFRRFEKLDQGKKLYQSLYSGWPLAADILWSRTSVFRYYLYCPNRNVTARFAFLALVFLPLLYHPFATTAVVEAVEWLGMLRRSIPLILPR